jgi:calcineurin-like phosphoesterase family protein
MWWFTSDEHYGHKKIIKYCDRPFNTVEEMNQTIIAQFNSKVAKQDTTVHIGDTCWAKSLEEAHSKYIRHLNGNHIFVKGSHDHWLPSSAKYMWRKMIDGKFVVCCHYAMRTWERSFHYSWQFYGHWHKDKGNEGLQYNVCVDVNDFYPVSLEEIGQVLRPLEEKMRAKQGRINYEG